ncbi:MAG: hypothetical protein R3C14_44790 [Caldilineaceae bacterium]
MPNTRSLLFVLWGPHFDEVAAALFVTGFRHVGCQVKVVGLEARPVAGRYGLTLTPDIALGRALSLTKRLYGVVAPCTATPLLRFACDPRLSALLAQAKMVHSYFWAPTDITPALAALGVSAHHWARYPDVAALPAFVHMLAQEYWTHSQRFVPAALNDLSTDGV